MQTQTTFDPYKGTAFTKDDTDASKLDMDQIKCLVQWCDYQQYSFTAAPATLQNVLDLYHASIEWADGFEGWLAGDTDQDRLDAIAAYNRIMPPEMHLEA